MRKNLRYTLVGLVPVTVFVVFALGLHEGAEWAKYGLWFLVVVALLIVSNLVGAVIGTWGCGYSDSTTDAPPPKDTGE